MASTTRLAAALVAASALLLAPAAGSAAGRERPTIADRLQVADTDQTFRIAGATRYETSTVFWENFAQINGSPDRVWLAVGEDYPDALAASAAAAGRGASDDFGPVGEPLMLTKSTSVPSVVLNELRNLSPRTVALVGGEAVITPAVRQQVADALYGGDLTKVVRVSGSNRYATAAKVARSTSNPERVAYLATGTGYADALSASWVAGGRQAPVLLTRTDALPAETRSYLVDAGVTQVVIAGGTAVVTEGVRAELEAMGITVSRVSGSTRYATSAAVSRHASSVGFNTAYGVPMYASGEGFADALVAGAANGPMQQPVLLTKKDALPSPISTETRRITPMIGVIVGGTAAVSVETENAIADVIASGW